MVDAFRNGSVGKGKACTQSGSGKAQKGVVAVGDVVETCVFVL